MREENTVDVRRVADLDRPVEKPFQVPVAKHGRIAAGGQERHASPIERLRLELVADTCIRRDRGHAAGAEGPRRVLREPLMGIVHMQPSVRVSWGLPQEAARLEADDAAAREDIPGTDGVEEVVTEQCCLALLDTMAGGRDDQMWVRPRQAKGSRGSMQARLSSPDWVTIVAPQSSVVPAGTLPPVSGLRLVIDR